MAIAMRTFGSNLSDLQALTNADRGLDYQRANAQDAINARRLEAFLKLRGEQLKAEAQRKESESDWANRLKLGEMDAQSRLAVAKERGIDPRVYQNFAQIQALNQEKQQRFDYLTQLSGRRQRIKQEMDNMMKRRGPLDRGAPNSSWWWRTVSPEWMKREEQLKQLDAEAMKMIDPDTGLSVVIDPGTGGYVIPSFTPIPIPDFGQTTPQVGRPQTVVPVEPVLPFAGGEFRGTGAGASWDEPPSVVPVPGTTNRFRWTPNGAVAY